MNKVLTLILLCIFGFQGYSQNFTKRDKFRNISLSAGLRSFFSEEGTVSTSYVDDSPSMDSFMGESDLDKYINRVGFALNYHWGRMKGLSHQLGIEAVFGLSESVHLGYGFGYSIPIEMKENTMIIRPAFNALIGNSRINLGRLINNAAYIQIGDTQFFDDELRIKLNTSSFLFRPKIDFIIPVSYNITIFSSLGYDFGSSVNSEPTLWFETLNGEETREVDLQDNKAEVNFNGTLIKEIPFDLNGPRISIGVSYYWEKN